MKRAVALLVVVLVALAAIPPLVGAAPAPFCERNPWHRRCNPPTPTPAPTPTATPSPTPTPAVTPSPTPTPTPTPTPSPTPTPTPTPTPVACGSLQARIDATPSGGTLDVTGCAYSEAVTINRPMTLIGATISPASSVLAAVLVTADGVTLDRLTVSGAAMTNTYAIGIRTYFADDLTITGSTIEDVRYAGVMVLSAQGGRITGNAVRRIGVGGSTGVTNAYGIAISQQNPDTDPQSSDVLVEGNIVEDVPTWHGLDTHAGIRVTFHGNTVRNAYRAIVATGDKAGRLSTDVDNDGNHVYAGPTAYWALVSVYSTGGYIRNNTTHGWPAGREVLTTSSGDPAATAVGLTVYGNVFLP